MDPIKYRRLQLRKELIKSGAILLLALVLLLSAAFAWFGDDSDVSIEPFLISIKTEGGDVVLDESLNARRELVLPAATKLSDESISYVDFSNVLKIMPLEVITPTAPGVVITIDPAPGLHYYIDTEYIEPVDDVITETTDTELKYATIIKNNLTAETNTNDTSATFYYDPEDYDEAEKVYKQMVAVVYWADYDYEYEPDTPYNDGTEPIQLHEIIRNKGEITMNVLMNFKSTELD